MESINIASDKADLRMEYMEERSDFAEIFPNHEKIKNYAEWLEHKIIAMIAIQEIMKGLLPQPTERET